MIAPNPIINKVRLYGLTDIQTEYLFDERRFIVNRAGRRARKTIIGMKKDLIRAAREPEQTIYLAAPTQDQAEEIFLDHKYFSLIKAAKALGIFKSVRYSKPKITLTNGSVLRIVGLDRAQRIEGIPANGIHITEFANLKPGFWVENILPILADNEGWAILDSVPDYRYPEYNDIIDFACGGQILDALPIHGHIGTNPEAPEWVCYCWLSSDVLPEKEILLQKRLQPEHIFLQEYEGKVIKAGGTVYYAYGEHNYSQETFKSHRDTYLCYDFNVDPMTCLINQHTATNTKNGDKHFTFVKEFVVSDSNTPHTTEKVLNYLQKQKLTGELFVTGDPSGISRRSSGQSKSVTGGTRSDYAIITKMIKERGVFKYKGRPDLRRSTIKDRVASINAFFKNTLGETRQYVNIAECPWLHKDLRRQVWDKNGQLNDENGTIGHRSDAGSGFHIAFYPVFRKRVEYS